MAFAAIFVLAPVAFAESLQPEDVVRALVRAAHDNDLQGALDTADLAKIAAHPRHAQTPKALIGLLRRIDGRAVRFQLRTRGGWPDSAVVRMTVPVSMDFDLVRVKATIESQEDRYVVVAVHP